MRTFSIYTFGCKVNQAESEEMAQALLSRGYKLVNSFQKPDIEVINTCTVTSETDHKVRKYIHKTLRDNPKAFIIVTGCYVNRSFEEIKEIKGIDLVIKNEEKSRLGEILEYTLKEKSTKQIDFPFFPLFHTRAFLKIQDGCDDFCSYCIVPLVRGKPRSKPIKEVLEQINFLAANGVEEVVLCGVHLGRYGEDLDEKVSLIQLIEEILKVSSLKRIRLSSIEVNEISEELIKLLSTESRICHHLHIPLQSGDDKVLKRMGRKYTSSDYREIITKIKLLLPDIAITTDIMVGFPGEDEISFKNTLKLVEELRFKKLHVFRFSPRSGTLAASFSDRVPGDEIKRRAKILRERSFQLEEEFAQRFIGKELDVLVEDEEKDYLLTGISNNYLRLFFKGSLDQKGKIVKVKAKKVMGGALFGEII